MAHDMRIGSAHPIGHDLDEDEREILEALVTARPSTGLKEAGDKLVILGWILLILAAGSIAKAVFTGRDNRLIELAPQIVLWVLGGILLLLGKLADKWEKRRPEHQLKRDLQHIRNRADAS